MAQIIILGFKGHGSNAEFEAIYCGNSGTEGEEAARNSGGKGYVRIEKIVSPHGHRLPVPTEPAKTENESKSKKSKKNENQ